jgi:exosortase/archaeosortase family protein
MNSKRFENESPLRFTLVFLTLFVAFYYFNILFFGITSPGNHYNAFLADHLNYIKWLRYLLLNTSAKILNWMGYTAITSDYELMAVGHATLQLVYSCLGLGVISFFTAFVIAYPKKLKAKLLFIVAGILFIELLNILRFVLLALYWNKRRGQALDHHTIFDITIYIIIAVGLYFWVKYDDKKNITHAAN